ncbi:unnamed protein product [Adineta steineri]|uniref:Uncharacterized protein n=1 Tax=Adineta steineri TaxID=433720 RepID=A0A814R3W5_9BILA|nr:unnamed protein product [Adineta steineri]CAF1128855.1 unnamed protein product [Adineta steineri]CAF3522589.1 unnamed protein product [Adineta steineri]CAF3938860.1 unnamed protein product [Adineta steineri]
MDVGTTNIHQPSFYKDVLKNIKYYDVCFNLRTQEPKLTGESNVDIIVGRPSKDVSPIICIISNVTKYHEYNVIVGVISINITTNKSQFMINLAATEDNHMKSKEEIDFLTAAINYFCSRALLFGAYEIKNNDANEMLQMAKKLNLAREGDELGNLCNQIQDLQSIIQQQQDTLDSLLSTLNNKNKTIDDLNVQFKTTKQYFVISASLLGLGLSVDP